MQRRWDGTPYRPIHSLAAYVFLAGLTALILAPALMVSVPAAGVAWLWGPLVRREVRASGGTLGGGVLSGVGMGLAAAGMGLVGLSLIGIGVT
jgi:hypothetical protein